VRRISSLVLKLRSAGISISTQGGKLIVEGRPGLVTAEIRAQLRRNKAGLIAELDSVSGTEDSIVATARCDLARLLAAAYRRHRRVEQCGSASHQTAGDDELAISSIKSVHGDVL
jgi:hypothetical protein